MLNQSNTKYIFLVKDPHLCNMVDKKRTLKNLYNNDDGIEGKFELTEHNSLALRSRRLFHFLKDYTLLSIPSKNLYHC